MCSNPIESGCVREAAQVVPERRPSQSNVHKDEPGVTNFSHTNEQHRALYQPIAIQFTRTAARSSAEWAKGLPSNGAKCTPAYES